MDQALTDWIALQTLRARAMDVERELRAELAAAFREGRPPRPVEAPRDTMASGPWKVMMTFPDVEHVYL